MRVIRVTSFAGPNYFRWNMMDRKQFSCFSIESLIGGGVDGRQPRPARSVDVSDSCNDEQLSTACRGSSSWEQRRTTAHQSLVSDASPSTAADCSRRLQRTWRSAAPSNDRTLTDWSHHRCVSTMIGTNDPRTSLYNASDGLFTSGV